MITEDLKQIKESISSTGFAETIVDHPDIEWVEDEEFHKLRKDFIEARRALMQYLLETP